MTDTLITSPSPFKVGDRIRAVMILPDGNRVPQGFEIATVTELTARGFKYDYGKPKPFIPRWGLSFSGHGEVYIDEYVKQGVKPLWELATEEDERMAREENVCTATAIDSSGKVTTTTFKSPI